MRYKSKLITCLYCNRSCVKFGLYGKTKQRYKCFVCNKTFSEVTIKKSKNEKNIRLVLHLLLAGCTNRDIAQKLKIKEKIIKKWRKLYFKVGRQFLPREPLLEIRKLIGIYNRIEKSLQ